ncbi:sulfite exporter TauE/SafE family protein [Chryseolinea sp. T2]|uniref:sulfite exporter TauE/SafE family protein n=1 Tax=Chryseolinea sp. T2 TaxID=3129255 RepID=UPI003078791A
MSNQQSAESAVQTDAIVSQSGTSNSGRYISRRQLFVLGVIALVIIAVISSLYPAFLDQGIHAVRRLDTMFFIFVAGGFVAQMIDGSLGMAYGVSASTFLMSFGVPPAAASASIHTAEIFTSGISGLSHLKFRNVNKKLFRSLLIPGTLGAIAGAYILTSFESYNYVIRPIVAVYTLILGIIIIRKALVARMQKRKTKNIPALAAFGGFMDSVGGGGWGPIVASTLIAKGRSPRYTIGSVNLAEFFISFSSSLTFFATLGISYLQIIAGLVIGGAIAAPFAAYLTHRLPLRRMMLVVGVVIVLVSIRLIYVSLTR